jgi:hypothetical protein
MLVSEAAKQLKINTQTLRLALQQQLFPFGVAVKTSENRYTYYINETRLQHYLEGRDHATQVIDWSNTGHTSERMHPN